MSSIYMQYTSKVYWHMCTTSIDILVYNIVDILQTIVIN